MERIEKIILLIRGHKVILDRDLARLYGVPTKVLNQAVRRNKNRFPEDFMFQLTLEETRQWQLQQTDHSLRSQIVTLKKRGDISRSQIVTLRWGENIKYQPYAFTEHGILMLSSVLNSERAIHVNIAIMRAFIRIREILASHKDLAQKLADLEKQYDSQFKVVFDALRKLIAPPAKKSKPIGFQA